MPIHHIILDGPIVDSTGIPEDIKGDFVNLQQVREQYNAKASDVDEIHVHIKTPGGSTHEAFSIFDFLNSAPEKVKTIAEGIAASAGTILFAVGDEREVLDNAELMFHPPTIDPMGPMNAQELKEKAETLEAHTAKIRQFFKDKFGFDDTTVDDLMQGDNFLNADQVQEKGIAKKVEKLEAVASLNFVTKKDMENLFDKIQNTLKSVLPTSEIKATPIKLSDGTVVFLQGEGEVKEGLQVQSEKEGKPSNEVLENGEYTLEDGSKITVEDGSIKTITSKEEGEEAEKVDDRLSNMEKGIEKLAEAVGTIAQAVQDSAAKQEEIEETAKATTKALKMVTTEGKPYATKFDYKNLPKNSIGSIDEFMQQKREEREKTLNRN